MALRDPRDYYPTPSNVLHGALRLLHWKMTHWTVLDPACGAGNLVSPLTFTGATVHAQDLFEYDAPSLDGVRFEYGVDFLKRPPLSPDDRYDLVCTNPPYTLALAFIEHAMTQAHRTMMLLRLSMLGSFGRVPFWDRHPPDSCIVVVPRPQFVSVCPKCKTQHPLARIGDRCGVARRDLRGCSCPGKIKAGSDNSEYAWFVWQHEADDPLPAMMWATWKEPKRKTT